MSTHSSTCSPSRDTFLVPWWRYDRMRNMPLCEGKMKLSSLLSAPFFSTFLRQGRERPKGACAASCDGTGYAANRRVDSNAIRIPVQN
jgi:hypothetical protein